VVVKSSSTGVVSALAYGGSGYTPVPGNYDGDGKTDVAIYQEPTGRWFVRNSSTGADTVVGFGGTGYVPVRGDFDADGKNDFVVFHEASGLWYLKYSSTAAVATIGFGGSSSLNGGTTTATGFGGPGYDPVN
jgi:spore coat protein A